MVPPLRDPRPVEQVVAVVAHVLHRVVLVVVAVRALVRGAPAARHLFHPLGPHCVRLVFVRVRAAAVRPDPVQVQAFAVGLRVAPGAAARVVPCGAVRAAGGALALECRPVAFAHLLELGRA